ncbi:MAG: hypothetical protein QM820_63630 [Minicystis sp.]
MGDLAEALAPLGLTLAELRRTSGQLVIFGSRAAGFGRTSSDWDLLAVGAGRSRHTPALDLVWVSERELGTAGWLSSELAAHVARWGRWLHGTPDWTAEVRCGEVARARKARRLASRLAALEKTWSLLPAAARLEERTLLRRDLQRHALLAEGQPVPPSRVLDDAWTDGFDEAERILGLASRADVCSAFCEALARAR